MRTADRRWRLHRVWGLPPPVPMPKAMTIRELLDKASPAPWRPCAHVSGTDADCPCDYAGDVWDATGEKVVLFLGPVDPHGMLPPTVSDEDRATGYANGLLTAVMRASFPFMLDALEYIAGRNADPPSRTQQTQALRAQQALYDLADVVNLVGRVGEPGEHCGDGSCTAKRGAENHIFA